jgi:uncharacterized membrane protein required for colicin V production
MGMCVYAGYRRGLILTLFRLVSFFLSIFFTMRFYPYMSRFLAQTALYVRIKEMVVNSMGLGNFLQTHTANQAAELIDGLPLPAALKELLLNNNTPDMYELLNVRTVEEYIGGFFAHMAVNIISMLLLFVLVWMLLRMVGGVLNVIGRLPVIRTFNRIGGLAAGFALGIVVVWLGLTVMSLLFTTPATAQANLLLQNSLAAQWLFNNNWMLHFII